MVVGAAGGAAVVAAVPIELELVLNLCRPRSSMRCSSAALSLRNSSSGDSPEEP